MASSTIRAMRLILYTLGFVSMFLVLFMAQRLEQRFQSLEARLLEISFKPQPNGQDVGGSKRFIETSLIMKKARQFREYASNAEAILESMELARKDEEELAMSGVSLGKGNRIKILGGLGLGKNQTFGNLAAQSAEKEESERKKQENMKQIQDLEAMEAQMAKTTAKAKNESTTVSVLREVRITEDADEEEARMTRLENEEATYHKPGDTTPHVFAQDHAMRLTNKDGSSAKDNVLVVIISNRRDGIIPTVASIITTSTRPVDIVLIGEHEINEQVGIHFGDRINEFTSMSVKDVEDDLVAQGYTPIWTWKEWHTSMDPKWKNENTLHVGAWDNLMTHAHVLNHIRFYLPLCSIFKGRPYFYFLDDDILVQRDLGELAVKTMHDLPPERGLVCPCNIWMWNSACFHFEFQTKKDYILSMPSLYGDRGVCKTEFETHCVPENYWDWVRSVMPPGGESQHAWNFGFSLFGIDNWVKNNLTAKYEYVMKQSYERHVFPETSLTFGLGVAYIAFAGAVECWNEGYVQVRDGFGFIEWDRYASTFGDDFFKTVDVVHYTGPDKPWVNESRIEQRAIVPWLKVMEQEGMAIPKQLPLEPTNNLFTVLAGDRTGAHWIMSVLDSHPEVCASGEADKPETGFSADVLLPNGLPWYPYCSIKRGCSIEFYKTNIQKLIENIPFGGTPKRCMEGYDTKNDELGGHLKRMCNIVKRLNGNYTDGAIAKVWVDGFIEEDRAVTGCGCVRGVKAKGLKVLAEWITYRGYPGEMLAPPQLDLNNTRVVGSKIIRLKRQNTWARYKSMMIAIATDRYHPMSIGEKIDQLGLLPNLTIDVHHMEWNMNNFMEIDRAGDEWAMQHASEILWLDYEDCRLDTATCFTKIYEFIGVDPTHVSGKHKHMYESSFKKMQERDSNLESIANRGEIKEVLGGNGWGSMIGGEKYTPIQLMMYHSEETFVRTFQAPGTNTILFGNDPTAEGFGNKFKAAVPYLRSLDPDALVVLCDDRDCWTNFPVNDKTYDSLYNFRENFDKLVNGKPGAIVASGEVECCASALTHISPGDLFSEDGRRKKRACLSGDDKCLWTSDSNAEKWRSFMSELAASRALTAIGTKRAFIDASVLVGKAKDFLSLIERIDFRNDEDDRAVLADYMYRFPDNLVIDHEQIVIGQAREMDVERNPACPKWHKDQNIPALEEIRRLDFLSSTTPTTRPLFLFSPRYHGCDHTKKPLPDVYPTWGSKGIALQPLLDHIERVEKAEESIVLLPMYGRVPDYRQGPELPYFVDNKGIWTSNTIRKNTDESTLNWRLRFAENNKILALKILYQEARSNPNNPRWKALLQNIKSGIGFFYWAWYGDYKSCNYKNYEEESIPILTTCASRFCDHAFPIPNYMNIIDSQSTSQNWRGVFREFEEKYPWKNKINKIIWRGALSEAEWREALTSVRWRVNKKVTEYNLQGSKMYDVGLTGIPRWLTTRVKFNITEVGGFLPTISPMTTFMNYKAILDMDGNSWSSRFGTLLCYNSVVVKVEPKFFEYFFPELKPWKHYIPVKNDLSDFDKNVRWALDGNNEKAVLDIIESANDWCSHRFLPEELARDQLDVWESYVREMNRGDKKWEGKLASAKKSIFSRDSFNATNIAPGLALL